MTQKKIPISQTQIFWGLVVSIIFSMSLYIYFVNTAIFNTAERQNIEESLVEVKTKVSELELQFIDKTRNITIEYANSLGFTEIEPKNFVERDPSSRFTLYEL